MVGNWRSKISIIDNLKTVTRAVFLLVFAKRRKADVVFCFGITYHVDVHKPVPTGRQNLFISLLPTAVSLRDTIQGKAVAITMTFASC